MRLKIDSVFTRDKRLYQILLLTYSINRLKGLECVKWVIQKLVFYILLGPVF